MHITSQVEQGPMTRFQIVAITVCIVINMMDGFDVLVMAFTAPSISAEWQLSNAALGWLLSSGLLGMALGSLVLGPLADRIGRRKLILLCLLVIGFGMLLSAFSQNAMQLTILRFLTGLGIGGILPGLNTMVSEYSSLRWRSFWVSFMQTGYPIGATLGGILTVFLIAEFGWRSAFLLGAVAAFIMIPAVWRLLPESLDFLLTNQPPGALRQVNRMLQRMRLAEIDSLPVVSTVSISTKTGYAELASNALLRNRTILLCLAFFVMMLSFYFVMSWTPKILVDSGMSAQQGISGGIILNIGGVIGSLLLGYMSSRLSLPRLIQVYVALTMLLMVVFSQMTGQIGVMVIVAVFLGFFLFGSMVGLYALAPQLYPTQSRAAGISLAIGLGRMGGVAAPVIAGFLFEVGVHKADGYLWFALPLCITIAALILLARGMNRPILAP
jgi:benzoate transport